MMLLLIDLHRDFASDVNLCLDIWITENMFDELSLLINDESKERSRSDFIILIVAFGSAIFVILPYITNLIVAVRIKNIIKTNEAAKAWYVLCIFIASMLHSF